jgi:hypothetical protein
MIDNPKQVANLKATLNAALPVPAMITPRLAALLRQQSPGATMPPHCHITWVSNMGDEGGIVCKLSVEGEKQQFFSSITHLEFDRRSPLAAEIIAYQKRRVRKLMRKAA